LSKQHKQQQTAADTTKSALVLPQEPQTTSPESVAANAAIASS
jgi:hypothetical protein